MRTRTCECGCTGQFNICPSCNNHLKNRRKTKGLSTTAKYWLEQTDKFKTLKHGALCVTADGKMTQERCTEVINDIDMCIDKLEGIIKELG